MAASMLLGVGAHSEPANSPELSKLRVAVVKAAGAQRITARWALAQGLADRGRLLEAERTLREAAVLPAADTERRGTALRLASVLAREGKLEREAAMTGAEDELETARASGEASPSELIAMQEIQATLFVRGDDLAAGEKAFLVEADQAHAAGFSESEARARVNALRAHLDQGAISGVEERLVALDQLIAALPPGRSRALLYLASGDLYERAVRELLFPVALRARAYEAISRAQLDTPDASVQAYAAGLLGQLYQGEGRSAEALRLTARAIFLAQQAEATDQLYRWEWQAARVQQALGDDRSAEQSFGRALFSLSKVRDDVLSSSRHAFSTLVQPVYLGYVDTQLKSAAALDERSPELQLTLRRVRDELESLKRTELQDYLGRACAANASANAILNIPGTAVIYPIVLHDRLEVLIESGGVLHRFAAPVAQSEVIKTVRLLRIALEEPSSGDRYRAPAEQLYGWLLAGVEDWLQTRKVTTLVFVPDGALRTVPLAALYDGKQFVIERYSVATTPALSLVPTLENGGSRRVLLAGLTESVQGFAPLPKVDEELHAVGAMFNTRPIEDRSFRLETVREGLTRPDFSIAHLATHGEFNADHRRSYVLTYDDKLTLDGLRQVLGRREAPLDLLVLSACKTAAGDDRAALGLAGVAVQSGARSALASLWSISDEATSSLMQVFYRDIKSGVLSKAQSLRDAQLKLLSKPQFRHPSYWAPYLMIGDWS